MEKWTEERNNTEEFRVTEDRARIFFDNEVIPHIPKTLVLEELFHEAKEQFSAHPNKDKILEGIHDGLEQYKKFGKITLDDSGRIIFPREEDRKEAKEIDDCISSFFDKHDLFKGKVTWLEKYNCS